MKIQQWEDKGLAHFSYAIVSDCEKKMVLIDPARNPQPYLDYAQEQGVQIVGIIETHPHADFVSSHLELHERTGATVYTSSLAGVHYPHQPFDEGNTLQLGKITLTSIHTPGHSPDSISILLTHQGVQKAVFTGDTLFIGDCGRPDLREGAGNLQVARTELARQMYATLHQKLMPLPDEVVVYPAHGAGSLCGKALSSAPSSTIGAEKRTNWSLQPMSEDAFVQNLLADQPFIPAYFPYNVECNRKGAPPFKTSIQAIATDRTIASEEEAQALDRTVLVVDARDEKEFKAGHLPHSINIMEGTKFETWLGSIIQPGEPFYLAGSSPAQLQQLVERIAAIGYEPQVKEAFVLKWAPQQTPRLDAAQLHTNADAFTIVDVRNNGERAQQVLFPNSLHIPLGDLRKRVNEIPLGKPVVVHCAGGYRSAAASSLIAAQLNGRTKVFDLGEAVKTFSAH